MNKISDLKVNYKLALKNGCVERFIKRIGCGADYLEKSKHVHDNQIDWQKTNELNNKQRNCFKLKELL